MCRLTAAKMEGAGGSGPALVGQPRFGVDPDDHPVTRFLGLREDKKARDVGGSGRERGHGGRSQCRSWHRHGEPPRSSADAQPRTQIIPSGQPLEAEWRQRLRIET
jgi:hypothetical protein